jgi:hypothetical protein
VVENLIERRRRASSRCAAITACASASLGSIVSHLRHAIPLVEYDRKYPYEQVLDWLPASVRRSARTTSGS